MLMSKYQPSGIIFVYEKGNKIVELAEILIYLTDPLIPKVGKLLI